MSTEGYIPALGYDWLTRLYDPLVRLTTRERSFKKALVDQLGTKSGDKVLDLACGTGTLAILLKEASPDASITGIDGDPKILAIAQGKAHARNAEIRFDQGMSFDLPYPGESFDCVVSSLFFHHLSSENKRSTLREVGRVLKTNGELHIADWGKPANLLMKLGSWFIQVLDGPETTLDNFDGRLPAMVVDAGFTGVQETSHFNSLFGTIRLLKAIKQT